MLLLIGKLDKFAIKVSPTFQISDPLSGPAHPLSSTGLTAVATYDYQKQDDDEISFEPGDVITNIEQVYL